MLIKINIYSEDFDDMLEKVSMWCGPAEQLVQNIDIIELESQKGRTEIRKRENDTEILDIEVK